MSQRMSAGAFDALAEKKRSDDIKKQLAMIRRRVKGGDRKSGTGKSRTGKSRTGKDRIAKDRAEAKMLLLRRKAIQTQVKSLPPEIDKTLKRRGIIKIRRGTSL